METTYYHLDARRLTGCAADQSRIASGGQETVCYAFTAQHRKAAAGETPGKVLDFNAYRVRLQAATEADTKQVQPNRAPRGTGYRRLGVILDSCATVAVIVAVVVFALRVMAV